ncbi:MAG: helix-turn-helix transcriptional regulator [Clostridia bacterium]|nr:helix-turn-helix transcriptional regulator [Clostridia bacterium]
MLNENSLPGIKNSELFKPEIVSIWHVKRDMHAQKFTQSLRSIYEPKNLFCVFITYQGTGKLSTDKKTYLLQENTLFIVRVDDIKTYNGSSETPWKYFCFNYVSEIKIPFFEYDVIYNVSFNNTDKSTLESLFTVITQDSVLNNTYINSQLLALLTKWAIDFNEKDSPKTPYYQTIRDCISHIQLNINKNLTVVDLAKMCNLSESTFYRAFVKIIGISPKKYILDKKLNQAKLLLKFTSNTIENISFQLGYYSPFQFSRDFKKKFGISPKHYRLQLGN